ncbi:amino acid ABC transporter permease [Schleiferilactobacillus shenzhenensis]|uniref:GlnM n=1 Tax=Schleiferilactobacillus shenzhenensis LY-73 TaxID=1231336 RepID=U4TKJ6_9LACO|nr:amino acid ABC transporter permease [Schleiferilactobacillus shenzhenensis]ERL64734.1 GlnM [Schleiferilactobacillus shenzhenensis LY-73]
MWTIFTNNLPMFMEGLGYTLGASLLALLFSLIIGTVFALLQINPNRIARIIGRIYVEFFRNVPLLVITMFFYVVIPRLGIPLSGFAAGSIGLTLYTSAFIAETVRAGIQSVDPGQMEAARSNGMTYVQAMRYIVLPQAIKITVPPLGNQFINLVKNSSVLAFVAGFDLMYQGNLIASSTFETMSTYAIIGVLYLIITLPLSYGMTYLDRRWSGANKREEA